MNINAEKATSLSLHNAYNKCLKGRLDQWLQGGAAKLEDEWCVEERGEWMNHMRKHLPTEFENIKKLEERTF